MGNLRLKSKHLVRLGFPKGELAGLGLNLIRKHFKHQEEDAILARFADLLAQPDHYLEDEVLGVLAEKLMPEPEPVPGVRYELRDQPQNFNVYGQEGIRESTVWQMDTAMRLPVARAGALMPDAHKGYGLPVGGVLATEGAVIPYAVGMDIGCRMALSVWDLDPGLVHRDGTRLKEILKANSRFGKDFFAERMDHAVLDRPEFGELPLLRDLKDVAARQIGSSGGGNHFVELGWVEMEQEAPDLGLGPGRYLALLTHSGSRALGATIAQHFTDVARERCRLPKSAKQLAWLDMAHEAGQAYWMAMNLAGDYASACHEQIHLRMQRALGAECLAKVENHHNFAWKERLPDGQEAIVHRKGATPAHKGELGIIPGSMTAPGFVVRGKGHPGALSSASHGAGRQLSRTRAHNSVTRSYMHSLLERAGVQLIGGTTEESPTAYKDIHAVMAAQTDLVEVLAAFYPKIVRMDR